jgi:hypothetical protein
LCLLLTGALSKKSFLGFSEKRILDSLLRSARRKEMNSIADALEGCDDGELGSHF